MVSSVHDDEAVNMDAGTVGVLVGEELNLWFDRGHGSLHGIEVGCGLVVCFSYKADGSAVTSEAGIVWWLVVLVHGVTAPASEVRHSKFLLLNQWLRGYLSSSKKRLCRANMEAGERYKAGY